MENLHSRLGFGRYMLVVVDAEHLPIQKKDMCVFIKDYSHTYLKQN
jgi:hypothetical protein